MKINRAICLFDVDGTLTKARCVRLFVRVENLA